MYGDSDDGGGDDCVMMMMMMMILIMIMMLFHYHDITHVLCNQSIVIQVQSKNNMTAREYYYVIEII